MELLRFSRANRTRFITVVIRPASKPLLSPLNSLERGGLQAPNGQLPMAPPKNTRRLELPPPSIGARWRTHES
jgi:hypothetical protein